MAEKKFMRLENISKHFGTIKAVDSVSFGIEKGKVIGLVGDNGAGKSTLIKCLAGYHTPTKGDIYIEGEKVKINNPDDAREFGIETVYQEQALAPDQNIIRNIFMGREPTKSLGFLDIEKMRDDSEKVLDEMELNIESVDQDVKFLSGGERQGVAIARAMYFKADLVILDEPTLALSIKEVGKVLDFVKSLKEENIACIIIGHDIRNVYSVSDRVIVMGRGEKIADVQKEGTSIDELEDIIAKS